ncbi:MAG: polysaccharide pyruvyl transferase family protein [Tissierellaceae bacterium]
MKKIGLVTIVDYKNYGNRLQNYATQQVLSSMGCSVTTILNKPIKKAEENVKKNFVERVKGKKIIDLFKLVITYKKRKQQQEAFNKKVVAFKRFSNKYINESNFIITVDMIPENLGERFDYFVVGSDQVWNPIFRKGSGIDFLEFAPQHKRISYAPSFGIAEIPNEYVAKYKNWLSEFNYLSVREDAGAKIIKILTDREAIVLVDPTVMLTKDEWIRIAKPHKMKPSNQFLLTYFLGEITKEVEDLIHKLSRKFNLEVVKLGSYEQIERYDADPSEFIDYINSSNIFLTDSFHGAVFSIILEKQFIVFNRVSKVPSMSSRIDTLLNKFKLIDRKWDYVKESKDYLGVDFSHTGPIFEYERTKAYKYLRNALDIEDAN